jgi:hypothetical protein
MPVITDDKAVNLKKKLIFEELSVQGIPTRNIIGFVS